MPWFDALIPRDMLALAGADFLHHVFHLGLIIFILTGWMFVRTLRLHLATLAVVWLSWVLLGLYVGNIGYCILTDWHWQVKSALGETHLPPSYLEYVYTAMTGRGADDMIVSNIAAAFLILATVLSAWRNWRTRKQRLSF